MELKVLKCPNCGANTTDHKNCEYCGSLLVRFAEKGIDLSKTTYTTNNTVIPGLIEELRKNLCLQKEKPDKNIRTDIYIRKTDGITGLSISGTNHNAHWKDGGYIGLSEGQDGLLISIDFCKYVDSSTIYDSFNNKMESEHSIFKELTSYDLFTSHVSTYVDHNGDRRSGTEYAINFGKDVEGAARLISEIWIKVKGNSQNDEVSYLTNASNQILKSREQFYRHSNNVKNENSNNVKNESGTSYWQTLLWVILMILCFIITQCS